MPSISIIVPVYNVRNYFRKCIESIINQTYKDIEIICVDDGSTDGSAELCDEYKKIDNRIKVIHKINEGLVSARQTGLKAATGKYVGFVDSDDWIEEGMYKCMFDAIEKYDVDMVETGIIDSYNESFGKIRQYKLQEGVYTGNKFKTRLLGKLIYDGEFYNYGLNTLYLWNKLFKREYIYECYMKLDFKQEIFEDFVSVYPYLIKHQSVAVINKAFYHYRVVNNSMKRTQLDNAKQVLRLHIKIMKEAMQNNEYEYELKQQFEYFKMFFMIMYDLKAFDDGLSEKILVPYGNIASNESLILYGAGVNGINIFRYLKENSKCKVVNWVDKAYKNINLNGISCNIQSPDFIDTDSDERIIITALKGDVANEIKNSLLKRGIADKRILWIKDEYIKNPTRLLEKANVEV